MGLTVVALVSLGLGGWWWTHPTLLSEESLGLGSGSAATKPVSESIDHVGVAGAPWKDPRPGETITFHGFHPVFRVDGAGLKFALSVCVPRMRGKAPEVIGIMGGDLGRFCAQVRPVRDGTTMRTGTREYLVATLTSTRPGRSTLTAISVNYSWSRAHLWQHGDDLIRGGITVRATG